MGKIRGFFDPIGNARAQQRKVIRTFVNNKINKNTGLAPDQRGINNVILKKKELEKEIINRQKAKGIY